MNNGAFGENFPYSNFHELNTDWIVKIAKDFLDQYTQIQQTIQTGMEELQEKYNQLEQALDQWYEGKTEELEAVVAEALNELNQWYDEHTDYLDQILVTKENAFDAHANEKTQLCIQSIPSDYTSFYNAEKGVYIDDTNMGNNNWTKFIQMSNGDWLCYFTNPATYGFPSDIGSSFYLHVSGTAFSSGFAYKTFYAFSNTGKAYFTMCGGSSSVTNLPAWNEILTPKSAILRGVNLDTTGLNTFLSITEGTYFVYLPSLGSYGFPKEIGQSFTMKVTGHQPTSTYGYKTYILYNASGRSMYCVCGGSTSESNLPKWYNLADHAIYWDENTMSSMGYSHFIDLPYGKYLILLNEVGNMGFPNQLGRSFLLDVTNGAYTNNNGFKSYIAYANNSYAMYTVCGTTSTPLNPPTWYELTNHSFSINKFDVPLDNCKLVLLGDSITSGSGATGLSGTETFTTSLGTQVIYDTGNSWAIKFAEYMAEQYPNVEIINHGWNGLTIGQLADYIEEFIPNGTTHCILGLGINSEGNTSFDYNISRIIKYLQSQNIKIFAWTNWLGTHPNMTNINTAGRVQAGLIHAYRNAGIDPLTTYSIALRFIEDHNIPFMDVMQYQPDNEIVHPNDRGHAILYRIIRDGFGF